MNPTNSQAAQFVISALDELPYLLHKVMDEAVTESRTFFEGRGERINTSLFPNLVRYFAKQLLENAYYKSLGYQVVELCNNGLFIIYDHNDCIYQIRILKADEDGGLPVHNLSEVKKDFFKQANPVLPGMEDLTPFVLTSRLKLVIIWDVDHNYILTTFQLVCPNGERGNVHFAGDIEHSATAIKMQGTFDEMADDLDEIEITPLKKTGSGTE
jgi:hypothetical protein